MDALLDAFIFILKTLVFVVATLVLFAGIMGIAGKNKGRDRDKLTIKKLNKFYQSLAKRICHATLPKPHSKQQDKAATQAEKAKAKSQRKTPPNRLFVLDFNGDIRASDVAGLREEISALLLVATDHDEIMIRLESPGGLVPSYGLAASQLARIRNKGIPLTVCIDKVAASGGYMMACVANKIIAAPFAMIGSIGVIAQVPNLNRLLKKHHIDFEQVTAGEYKRSISMLAPNTHKGKAKFKEQLEDIHTQFKAHIAQYRPDLNLDQVATGEAWLASMAKDLNLVDELMTSDDYILAACNTQEVFHVVYEFKHPMTQKISTAMRAGWAQLAPNLSKKQAMLIDKTLDVS